MPVEALKARPNWQRRKVYEARQFRQPDRFRNIVADKVCDRDQLASREAKTAVISRRHGIEVGDASDHRGDEAFSER